MSSGINSLCKEIEEVIADLPQIDGNLLARTVFAKFGGVDGVAEELAKAYQGASQAEQLRVLKMLLDLATRFGASHTDEEMTPEEEAAYSTVSFPGESA